MIHHATHEKELHRLNRAIGQLEGIKRMIEDKRYCIDILTQIRAARSALKTIELSVLDTHIKGCLGHIATLSDESMRNQKLNEIIALLKKYE
ncbi:TPA: metal-sensitive transcriptional regulator [Legionella anisa]|uniref:metal-sensitive transcriptional regulator n=1 Tax=Legionella anisa TaxID=28082 RepID=UPI000349419C|nr:metal-sensitive transcriptional regulator [Legionella anisa]AWN75899.1 metal-sensitive transcriptional regulator [Legionella anisa]MCW8426835.1 metal-sensitive transcriptional regulator [Legionella anisa]MCW8449497.1 metal-sensitive transcriptional regulator [Legionella anisa]